MTQAKPDWDKIKKCQLWSILGVTECNGCEHATRCWGADIQLPKPAPEALRQLRGLLQGGKQ